MSRPVTLADPMAHESRTLVVVLTVALLFAALSAQLVWLAIKGHGGPRLSMSEPIVRTFARPDIVDRNGRLIATDLEAHSLYADPAQVLDADEAAEKLAAIFPDLDQAQLRSMLADRSRRFVWLRRGLSPRTAQRIHDLGLPGLGFRREPKRSYPLGSLAGHVIGTVNVDNRGLSGIERHIDETVGVEAVLGSRPAGNAPVQLSIDIGVQHALEDELAGAVSRYAATGAAGIVMATATGEIIAAASLPNVDPARPAQALEETRLDKNFSGTFELGSIFKLVTIAAALDGRQATPDTVIDVRAPLWIGRHQIRDLHPAGRPLSVRDIFVQSSNVGAARLALAAGSDAQRAFLGKLGLLHGGRSESRPDRGPEPAGAVGRDRDRHHRVWPRTGGRTGPLRRRRRLAAERRHCGRAHHAACQRRPPGRRTCRHGRNQRGIGATDAAQRHVADRHRPPCRRRRLRGRRQDRHRRDRRRRPLSRRSRAVLVPSDVPGDCPAIRAARHPRPPEAGAGNRWTNHRRPQCGPDRGSYCREDRTAAARSPGHDGRGV